MQTVAAYSEVATCWRGVVGTLAHYADIPGHSIGKIRIQDRQTLVDVPEQFAGRVLANTRTYRIGKQAVTIERV